MHLPSYQNENHCVHGAPPPSSISVPLPRPNTADKRPIWQFASSHASSNWSGNYEGSVQSTHWGSSIPSSSWQTATYYWWSCSDGHRAMKRRYSLSWNASHIQPRLVTSFRHVEGTPGLKGWHVSAFSCYHKEPLWPPKAYPGASEYLPSLLHSCRDFTGRLHMTTNPFHQDCRQAHGTHSHLTILLSEPSLFTLYDDSHYCSIDFRVMISKKYLSASITEQHCLCDCERVVEVHKCVEFPFLTINSDEELKTCTLTSISANDWSGSGGNGANTICSTNSGEYWKEVISFRRLDNNLEETGSFSQKLFYSHFSLSIALLRVN